MVSGLCDLVEDFIIFIQITKLIRDFIKEIVPFFFIKDILFFVIIKELY